MPIKFRCEYCHQLIGIAESKAGSQVDCPTCGRTLSVPTPTGAPPARPVPSPPAADPELRQALAELAQLAQPVANPASVPVEPSPQRGHQEFSMLAWPQPTAPTPADQASSDQPAPDQPAPDQPPHDQRPMRQTAPDQQSPDGLPDNSPHDNVPTDEPDLARSPAIALEPLPAQPVIDPPPRSEALTRQPTAIARQTAEIDMLSHPVAKRFPEPPRTQSLDTVRSTKRYSLGWLIGTGVCCLATGTVGGYLWGRYSAPAAVVVASTQPMPPAAVPLADQAAAPEIRGRITWQADGKSRPDEGAVVILLPAKPAPDTELLSAIGLGPLDDDAARQGALERLAKAGGALAQANSEGDYQLDLPPAGRYHLIALSRLASRTPSSPSVEDTLLERHFQRPGQLVGQRDFRLHTVQIDGQAPIAWNVAFGTAETSDSSETSTAKETETVTVTDTSPAPISDTSHKKSATDSKQPVTDE